MFTWSRAACRAAGSLCLLFFTACPSRPAATAPQAPVFQAMVALLNDRREGYEAALHPLSATEYRLTATYSSLQRAVAGHASGGVGYHFETGGARRIVDRAFNGEMVELLVRDVDVIVGGRRVATLRVAYYGLTHSWKIWSISDVAPAP